MIDELISKMELKLSDKVVLTEAASGPYCVTPIIAARAGASRVYAFVKDNRFSTKHEVVKLFEDLNYQKFRISIIDKLPHPCLREIDLVTNSGNLRPIDERIIPFLKKNAIISLMYEKWERRESDINIRICKNLGIRIVAPFEFNATINFGSDLREMASYGLRQLGAIRGKIGLVCNNNFKESLLKMNNIFEIGPDFEGDLDYIVLARTSSSEDDYSDINFSKINCSNILQLWGNIDRSRLKNKFFYPSKHPPLNHMGVIPSDVGIKPVIKLQVAGLKVAQLALDKIDLSDFGEYVI